MDNQVNWLGVGFTRRPKRHVSSTCGGSVRRWLGGYRGADRDYAPLWTPQLPKLDDQLGLGFLDLMRVVARMIAETDISLEVAPGPSPGTGTGRPRPPAHHSPFPNRRAPSSSRSAARPTRLSSTICSASSTGSTTSSSLVSRMWISTSRSPDGGRSASRARWCSIRNGRSEPLSPAIAAFQRRLALAAERHGVPREAALWYPPATEREVRRDRP